jgi:hypothetical protein
MSTSAPSRNQQNSRLVTYLNVPFDLQVAGDVDLVGPLPDGATRFHTINAILDINYVRGTETVAAQVGADAGTDGQTILTTQTLTGAAEDRQYVLLPAANGRVVTGTNKLRLKKVALGVGQATTFRVRTDNIATLTTAAAHGLVAGDVVTISGVTGAPYNGGSVRVLTVPTTTTFTYESVGVNETSTADTGGRVGALRGVAHVTGIYY